MASISLIRNGVVLARWFMVDPARVDLALVEELALLRMAARRLDCALRFDDVPAPLEGLLELLGLDDWLRPA
jgi:hypothetical protein